MAQRARKLSEKALVGEKKEKKERVSGVVGLQQLPGSLWCAAQGAPDGWPACLLSSFPYIGGLASPKLSTSLLTVLLCFAYLQSCRGRDQGHGE